MANKEKPADGQVGGLHDLPTRTGLDDFEDRAKEAVRKQDRLHLQKLLGEILADLGQPEHDDEPKRVYREFVVRLLTEKLDAIGITPPPAGGDEYRITVAFSGEDVFSPFYLGAAFVPAGLLVALLRRINDCRFVTFPTWGGRAA